LFEESGVPKDASGKCYGLSLTSLAAWRDVLVRILKPVGDAVFKDVSSHRIKPRVSSDDLRTLTHSLRMLHLLVYRTPGFHVFLEHESLRRILQYSMSAKRNKDVIARASRMEAFVETSASNLSVLSPFNAEYFDEPDGRATERFLRWLKYLAAWEDAVYIVSTEPIFQIPGLNLDIRIIEPGAIDPTMTPIASIVDIALATGKLPNDEQELVRRYVQTRVSDISVWNSWTCGFTGSQHCESTVFALICAKRSSELEKLYPSFFETEEEVQKLDALLEVRFFLSKVVDIFTKLPLT
jgi:hypothetical protein